MTGHVVAAAEFVASRVSDGTSNNLVGNLVAALFGLIAAAIMGLAAWFIFDAFKTHKGKFKQAAPEILGIVATGGLAVVLVLKMPSWMGYTDTFLSGLGF